MNILQLLNLVNSVLLLCAGTYILKTDKIANKYKKTIGFLFTSFGIVLILFNIAMSIW
ncbi:hypothetical protein AM1BK_48900 [Neobacillus kokaensis]|uniref:Uncharacterized protein n=1 Tax=Neobacillus kokaensis TaxID=2759023 RepID=A0ABQ3NBR4_9BACI|nr:hypothetical protein AM1BK_48900 [Neobacillus kokaensis]